MKILWFSLTSAGLDRNQIGHNGGGWVSSLLEKLYGNSALQLAVAYEGSGAPFERNRVRFFPISTFSSRKNQLKRKLSFEAEVNLLRAPVRKIIEKFKPDLIHIFGSENPFGAICADCGIPYVIHIQGFLPAYENAKLPPKVGQWELFRCGSKNPRRLYSRLWFEYVFRKRAEREAKIVEKCQYFFGRTKWDKAIVSLYSPRARYFYCSEMLRAPFYADTGAWKRQERQERILVSVLSTPTYKGHDLILKTAALLHKYSDVRFRWKVFGGCDVKFWENLLHVSAADVGVEFQGVVSAERLRDELLNADVFVHPSYIENSPNSVCEAQLLGVPIIAVDAGGVSSLVEHNHSGLLVPANDPIMMADRIKKIVGDSACAAELGHAGSIVAQKRHDPEKMIQDLLTAYQEILMAEKVQE